MTADQLLQTLRSRVTDAKDLRDAVHEATHGVQTKLRGSWERERLHAALERKARRDGRVVFDFIGMMVRYELQARAVEMLACKMFASPHYEGSKLATTYNIEHWAFICWMETSKTYQVDIGSIDKIVDAINVCAKQRVTKALFDLVLALKPRKARS